MPVRELESKQNKRLKELRQALAAPGRGARLLAGRASLVGIEGPHLLEEALRAGLRVAAVFVAKDPDRRSERLLERLRLPTATEVLSLPRKLLDSALTTETPQSVAALVEPPDWTWAHVLDSSAKAAPLIVVMAGLQDPGNVGTILRSAEAFGASGVVSLPGTVSAWNPKVVRASAGSVFRVPVLAASERGAFEELREAGVRILATAAQRGQPANLADMGGPIALVIGNEGNGVREELAAQADSTITIPCPGPVESLNAAMAASVLLYEAARQRASSISHPFSAASGRAGERMGQHGAKRGARR